MHDMRRTANLLGATALAVTDLALGGATAAAGVSGSGAAALVVLCADPGISVTELGRRVGLTQSAAARMVDALAARGLVERRPTLGKWVAVHPTTAGRAASASSTRTPRPSSTRAAAAPERPRPATRTGSRISEPDD
jgi:DNA-binding MarR family transcriptional regulator